MKPVCYRQYNIFSVQQLDCQYIEVETKWTSFSRRHFQMHFLGWKCLNFFFFWILLKFISKCKINNILGLVHMMAWHRLDDKPLSEPMLISWSTHLCLTRRQRVNYFKRGINLCNLSLKVRDAWCWWGVELNISMESEQSLIRALSDLSTIA